MMDSTMIKKELTGCDTRSKLKALSVQNVFTKA